MTRGSRLELELVSLGDCIDWPTPSPHLTARVLARVESEEATSLSSRAWRRSAVAFSAVLVVTLVLVFSPSVRQAVADILSAAGIRVGVTSEVNLDTGAGLDLGDSMRLDDIRSRVDFDVRAPTGAALGMPDAVYVGEQDQVTMVWAGAPSLPAAGDTDVGLLLTQYEVADDRDVAAKLLGPETGVQVLVVEGQPALWVEGAAHSFTLFDIEGNPIEETTRLAANVLVWEAHGVNHRLETTGDLQSALAIVESLQPVS